MNDAIKRRFPKASKFLSDTGMTLDDALHHLEELGKKADEGA